MSTPHRSPALAGLALFAGGAVAMFWANVHPGSYLPLAAVARPLINDGLMALFFFVVGMELKRELVSGALSSRSKALLPAAAALGGMAAPALIFITLNPGGRGWGIPMATDIAFAVGVLALLGPRVPRALVVFVTALAVFDDLGGIVVIALFYGQGIDARWLGIAACLVTALWMVKDVVRLEGLVYAGMGGLIWYALHRSGVHATVSGVALALVIPMRDVPEPILRGKVVEREARLDTLVALWRPWVTWLVLPVFALANAGLPLSSFGVAVLSSPIALGIGVGLVAGKLIGIFGVTVIAVKLGLAPMPEGATLRGLFGVSIVAGIGFTVALFIAALAYTGVGLEQAKAGVLMGSLAAGLVGSLVLRGG
jgi:Na+:H+ antiporter, NhaA family